jgi:hypothetical protein
MVNIPLPSAYGKGESLRFDASRLVNLYAVPATQGGGARAPFYLKGSAGFEVFANIGTLASRMIYDVRGALYVIVGTNLYEVSASGAFVYKGFIDGIYDVSRDKIGDELVIVADNVSYVYKQSTATLTQITDPNFYISDAVTGQNQRVIFNRRATGQYFWSDTLNALSYDGLNIATAEANDDNLVAPVAAYDDLWLFGEQTTEVVREGAGGDYDRIPGAVLDVGIASKYAWTRARNALYWLSDEGCVYVANGYTPQEISTQAIKDVIFEQPFAKARMFHYSCLGNLFVVLSLPEHGRTFEYNTATGLWNERTSAGSVVGWQVKDVAQCYGKQYGIDATGGRVLEIKPQVYDEAGLPITRTVDMMFAPDNASSFTVDRIEFVVENGMGGMTPGLVDDPVFMLSWSKDGGRTFGNALHVSAGIQGQYQTKVVFRRLGQFNMGAVFRLQYSAKAPCSIVAADAILEGRGV